MNDQANFRQFRDRMANGFAEKQASYVKTYKRLSGQAEDNFSSDDSKARRNRQKNMAFLKGRMAQTREFYRELTGRELEI